MKHSIRWFAACAAIAWTQWLSWFGLAKENGERMPDRWMYLYAFILICIVAWWLLPQQRPLGFDRGGLSHDQIRARLRRHTTKYDGPWSLIKGEGESRRHRS